MPKIASVGVCIPPNHLTQETTMEFAAELFQQSFKDLPRLLKVFENAEIQSRNLAEDITWFRQDHTFEEKNNTYIKHAVEFGMKAIINCLHNQAFLPKNIPYKEIDAIFFISTTGISTPSIEAKIMNHLPFSPHTKRIPIWGLGCAGGAAGLSRAYEYCLAYPKAKVLVVSVELCSLTFQRNDRSKSNLVGTSLFSDGVAAVLVIGDSAAMKQNEVTKAFPSIVDTQSTLMPNSEEVMGWDIKNEGLFVIFSKDIPSIIKSWLKPNVEKFLEKHQLKLADIQHFIAHPGGKKVIEAYEESLGFGKEKTKISQKILREHGNMSSATVYYVLEEFMKQNIPKNEFGLIAALGPGFSSELLLVRWVG
ncbi:type III polyketide synthase [Bacillus suaedaesalsae]|uniref:Type III polyketide synthase n=1 Tax=Bacillus suaedaesalsae TaxID=2810349 RepID=A0ABS2DLE3_9BACI|nr:3-oxoacyl-[acyl-carrier-protein] synthase III C-terminal domain-containing protein [Bacillus suaedaesalsae]MBM6619307.1 type III polyketide synthase [Bacillus suaedaesalsae]